MSTDINKITINEESDNYIGGLLNKGDDPSKEGYIITKKLNTSSGEAEIYFCEKASKKYILKYYYRKNIFSDLEKKLKSLNHKNVMKIVSIGRYKKHSFEIDEYYEGGSLIDSQPSLSEEQVLEILKQMNEGLKAIHDAGIIHRDIKAENIYYKDATKKEIVIGDFGISSVYDQKDDINEHITQIDASTDGYKAPEAFNGIISPAIDYYSLGITFWNLVTGKTPFVEESGESFSSERIKYETIDEKVKDYLLAAAPELSEKSKKLISGLLVYRHDQRWGYTQIKDFLAGKDVEVYKERRELSVFEFCNKELFNLKEIADEMLKNKEEGIKLLRGNELTIYLDKNDLAEITQKIELIQSAYFSGSTVDPEKPEYAFLGGYDNQDELEEYGLIKAAFTLSSNIIFPLNYYEQIYPIKDLSDFVDLLHNHPVVVRPYLLNEVYGLYIKLDAIAAENNQESLSAIIKDYVQNNKNDRSLPLSIYLGITENKISPFRDKINGNIELRTKEDVYALSDSLKERLMYFIDSKDQLIIAWFENVFEINMSEWYGELEGGATYDRDISSLRRNKLLAFGKWNYFERFLKGQDVIYRNYYSDNGKCGLRNLDGSVLLDAQFDDIHCEFIRNHFIYKQNGYWNVVSKDEDGKYKNELSFPGEISVLDEQQEIYKGFGSDKDFLLLKGDENNPYVPIIADTIIGRLYSFSEINHPYERYINVINNSCELLDMNYKVVGKYNRIVPVTADGDVPKNLIFWATKDSGVCIIDKDGKTIEQLPYSGFADAGDNCFLVKNDEGKDSLVDYKNELIRKNVADYRASGIVATVKRTPRAKWEIFNLIEPSVLFINKKFKAVGYLGPSLFALNSYKKVLFFTDENNEIFTTTLSIIGKMCFVTNSKGLKKQFVAINIWTLKKICNSIDEKHHYYILGFDGKAFFKYNFDNLTFEEVVTPSVLPEDELYDLMDSIDSKIIINLVKKYIAKNQYEKANIIINLTWKYYYDRELFEEARFLLSSVRMDKEEGLDLVFLAYKNYLGYTYLKENEKLTKPEDYAKRNLNYVFALHYFLSVAGKEINDNGEIITAPYLPKLMKNFGWRPGLAMNCAEVCIDISNLSHYLYLSFDWTKEYIKKVALEIMEELYTYYTDKDYTSNPYLDLDRLGDLFEKIGDRQKAIAIHRFAIPYEQGLSILNTAKCFALLYDDRQYQEALAVYEVLQKTGIDLEKEFPDFVRGYKDCRHILGYED